jgi:LmbE family N-acetylglucosaminyl deacetylase
MVRLDRILTKNRPAYFISPHLDDAMLSAGGLIHYLVSKGVKVTVITLFTRPSPPPYSMHAIKYVRQCGGDNAEGLFKERAKEDEEVFGSLGIRTVHLGFIDAAWRKKKEGRRWMGILPELVHLYPFRFCKYMKKLHPEDRVMMEKIRKRLAPLVTDPDAPVLCPMAIGNHIDHIITKEICMGLFKTLLFWSDFPYSLEGKDIAGYTRISWNKYLAEKIASIKVYRTQQYVLFGRNPPPVRDEQFYLPDIN